MAEMTGDRIRQSLRTLLGELIDYAGLFPPAKLDMATSVANYASYLIGDDAWMLNRLIVPVSRLDEFEQHAASHLPKGDGAEPWRISALTVSADDPALAADIDRISDFNDDHAEGASGLAVIDVVELKASTVEAIDGALDMVDDELYPFFELPIETDPRGLIAALAGSDAGAKVRTGGVTADAFPRPAHLARFVHACEAAAVPFKATAGLHHPLRQHRDEVNAKMYGFLNVFIAACCSWTFDLPENQIETILTEERRDAFSVEDAAIRCGDLELDTQQIEDARLAFAVSFGSCSFDEPRDDLRALGFLP
jgi:hypothetical protein